MSDNTDYSVTPADDDHHHREAKRPCLIMIKGDFIGQVYDLSEDVMMIGRSDDVQLVISDASVSRRHAMIVNRLGRFHLSDLGSTNGTFLNKQPVRSATPIQEGDKVGVGDITFKFSYQDEDDTTYHLMLRNMAIKDGLTRVFNRRYFHDAVEKEFDYTRRNRSGLAIILFDIDDFKIINDEYGHPAGDMILKGLAEQLDQEARDYDVFARYGGEEFAFLMRGATGDTARALAERVRTTVEDATFDYEGTLLNVTVSLGVGYWSGEQEIPGPDTLVKLADEQMYEAKRAGKNSVRIATV